MAYSDATQLFGNPFMNASTGRFRILLIEDDAELAEELRAQLLLLFPEAQLEDRATADALISEIASLKPSECPYDLVVSDFLIPGGYSGIEVWGAWKAKFPRAPFLLISGILSDQSLGLQKGVEWDAKDSVPEFLPKPFTLREWREKLIRLVDAA